jgi:hypothetical protein
MNVLIYRKPANEYQGKIVLVPNNLYRDELVRD